MPNLVKAPYSSVVGSTHVVLESGEPVTAFSLSLDAARQSATIQNRVVQCRAADAGQSFSGPIVIRFDSLSPEQLFCAIEYMEHHCGGADPQPRPFTRPLKGPINDYVGDWDRNFFWQTLLKHHDEKQHRTLSEVLIAADVLQVKELAELCAAGFASLLQGRSSRDIRVLLGMECDLTEEELGKMSQENAWTSELV